MNHFYLKITKFYKSIVHGVSFIPALIAIFLFVLAVFVITAEYKGLWDGILSAFTFLRVRSTETARSMMAAILGGMISLTVFTFSMVMVVINQASSNYSPKLIEGFINNKTNKYILGVFVGTIIFSLTTLMHIEDDKERVPDIAIFISILLILYSIALFVQFINEISNSVKITNVVNNVYRKTKKTIESDGKELKERRVSTDNWITYESGHSGYFQQVSLIRLKPILKKHDLMLKVFPAPGFYIMKRNPLFSLNRRPENDEVIEDIKDTFITYSGEDIEDNEFYGFRQLREVAVKGLSPGINDPGIAKLSIDYLGDLFSLWLTQEKKNVVVDDEDKPRIILQKYDLEELLATCITPIKTYGKRDFTIVDDLLHMFLKLSYYDEEQEKKRLLNTHAIAIVEDADEGVQNFLDREILNKTIWKLNGTGYFSLPFLLNEQKQKA